MKRYKISESNLNEFWGLFGKPKPQSMQQIIDNDPILKKLDAEIGDMNTKYEPKLRQMKREDPEFFKKLQKIGLITKDFK